MGTKITLELTHDELLTLGMAMGDYVSRWMVLKKEAINNGDMKKADTRQKIIDEGFNLWDKIQTHY